MSYQIGDNVIEWSLADDRRSLTLATREKNGERKMKIGWDHPATDAEVERALNPPTLPFMKIGERRYARRWIYRNHTVWFHKMSGPPTWWWPRCFIHQGALVIGWWRRAIAIAIKPTRARNG